MERWRRPVIPVAVEEDPNRIYHDGHVYRRQIDVTFDPETFARMRLGYACFRCWEPQEEAMPISCSLCGYSMRDLQLQDIAKEFEGTKHIGPSTSIDDEVERIRDEKARERYLKGSSIWIPGGAA